jgi:glycosyltransferase involved in cell wall biosynthesis
MRCAVVITTYNRPDALAAVLEGFLRQTDPHFELVVADDGSTAETRAVVQQFQAQAAFPLLHVWQEDLGFRAAAARNRALMATAAEYVIFTDGDCIPGPGFVAAHKQLAQPGRFLAGNRVLVSEAFTRELLARHLPVHTWSRWRWWVSRLRGQINRWAPLIRLPDGAFRSWQAQRWQGVKTCNLSAWRADLLRINGFDEAYSGWGMEDSDLVVRLLHAGVCHKSARFATPVFHLWHRENDRSRLPENQQRLQELLHARRVVAQQGCDQYAPPLVTPDRAPTSLGSP